MLAYACYTGDKNGTMQKSMVHYPYFTQIAVLNPIFRTAMRDLQSIFAIFFIKNLVNLNCKSRSARLHFASG